MNQVKGVLTALITPFKGGRVDFSSFARVIEQQIQAGIHGFVINGTTGESPTLSESEVEELFRFARKQVGAQFPLVVGTGLNSTAKSIELTKRAEEWGADAALVVVPYYNKPPQRGLVAHFKAIAEATRLPVILYNVPGRTITALELETIRELSHVPNIVGIKEASGNIDFAKKIREACGPKFLLLSGDDGTYAQFLEVGGNGVISVASHVIPAPFVAWTEAAWSGQTSRAVQEIEQYRKMIDLLFVEANPIPVKRAMKLMKIIESSELRLPLVEMSEPLAEKLKSELVYCGILK